MLRDFRQKLQKLSLGKRKFILDKMNTNFPQNEEDHEQRFIYAASLLLDDKKTLEEAIFLSENYFSVTSAQYEYYFLILNTYKNSLTDIGRKRFCTSVMKGKTSQKILAISAKMRQNEQH